jgi:hypothetical protein
MASIGRSGFKTPFIAGLSILRSCKLAFTAHRSPFCVLMSIYSVW